MTEIVASLVRRDFRLAWNVPGVRSPTPWETRQLLQAVQDYGDVTLLPLPPETWTTSVCSWRGGDRWQCLIDLWTKEEGPSDLVMSVDVIERRDDFEYSVHLVYVP